MIGPLLLGVYCRDVALVVAREKWPLHNFLVLIEYTILISNYLYSFNYIYFTHEYSRRIYLFDIYLKPMSSNSF